MESVLCLARHIAALLNCHATCSVLQRMLRRNPLAALALHQPSMRSISSLSIADDAPFSMDDTNQPSNDLPDGMSHEHIVWCP